MLTEEEYKITYELKKFVNLYMHHKDITKDVFAIKCTYDNYKRLVEIIDAKVFEENNPYGILFIINCPGGGSLLVRDGDYIELSTKNNSLHLNPRNGEIFEDKYELYKV